MSKDSRIVVSGIEKREKKEKKKIATKYNNNKDSEGFGIFNQKATVASNCIKIPKLPLNDLEDDLQNNTEGHTKDTTLKAYREEQF